MKAAESIHAYQLPPISDAILQSEEQRINVLLRNPGPERAWQLRDDLGKTMSLNLGIFRTKQSIEEALGAVQVLNVAQRTCACRTRDASSIPT